MKMRGSSVSKIFQNGLNQFKNYLKTPIGKITFFNSVLFMAWNIRGASQAFLVDHFSFERSNLANHRFHTAITYAFSHLSTLNFGVNMLMLQLIGNNIQKKYGSKYVWGLYLSGAIAGSLAMYFWMPFYSIPIPKVGAEPSISALFSFYSILNPKAGFRFLFLPIKVWFIFGLAIIFTILSDPSRKNISGILIGSTIGLMLRRRLI